jgi:hypothetical protein
MRVFLAGVIQGSQPQSAIHDQGYRQQIASVLQQVAADVEIIDPHRRHPERFGMDRDGQRSLFLRYVAEAAEADLLIAYLPTASMGTAVEMWAAHRAGVPIITVSPLRDNWVIFSLSTIVVSDIDALRDHLRREGLPVADTGRVSSR